MTRIAAALCLLSTLLLAACGGSGSSAGADPAALAPADAPLYAEGVVRPEGELREGVLAAFGKISGADDPAAEIRRLFDEATEGEVDYDSDIAPWLGERAGVWATNLQADEPGFAVIVATTDPERALAELEESARESGDEIVERSHEGTEYLFSVDENSAAATVDDFLVIATEPELKRTIDVADGDSLADSGKYSDVIDDLPEDRLASFYIDQRALFAVAASAQGGPEAQLFNSFFKADELEPVAAALVADGERIAIDWVGSTAGNNLANLGAFSGAGTELVGALPSDAWAAFGISDLGEGARKLYETFAGALGGAAIENQFRNETGLDLTDDVFGWIGDVAVYVSGVGESGFQGAVVIEVTDAGKATTAFGKLAGLLRTEADADVTPIELEGAESAFEIRDGEIPQVIVIARGPERVVLAFGREAAAQALSPSERLEDSDVWERSKAALDDEFEPAFFMDMGKLLDNIEAFGAGKDPDFRKARPYLDAVDVITAGGETDGDEQKGRLSVGLK